MRLESTYMHAHACLETPARVHARRASGGRSSSSSSCAPLPSARELRRLSGSTRKDMVLLFVYCNTLRNGFIQ